MMTKLPYDAYLQVAVLGFGVSVHEFWQMSPSEFKVLWKAYKTKEGLEPPISKSDLVSLTERFGRTGQSLNALNARQGQRRQ